MQLTKKLKLTMQSSQSKVSAKEKKKLRCGVSNFFFLISVDYFKFLSKSFSLPNLTYTPFEALLPTEEELLAGNFCYSDDFEMESLVADASPQKKVDEDNEMWTEEAVYKAGIATNIFEYLESQRVILEQKIGVATLLKVYRMIARLEQSVDERIDYSDLTKVLGKGNEDLIDDIIQLVVAEQFFN